MTDATIGLAHTRWATHGKVTEQNAHPHRDCEDRVHIVLNGIVENHAELRSQLEAEGHRFSSETDAEIVAHLIERHHSGDLTEAVRDAVGELRGHYAFVAMHTDHPGTLVGARQECPLIVGIGEQEAFLASAIPAFMAQTRSVLLVENGEIVTVDSDGASVIGLDGAPITREIEEVTWDEEAAEMGGYPTFMMKEIHDQPDSVAETIAGRLSESDEVDMSELGISGDRVRELRRIVIVACGTSYHAGLVGRYAIEQWARVPVEMDIASEYRYRDPVVGPDDLVIGITQSGETADTLAALRYAKDQGQKILSIVNVPESTIARESDAVLHTNAGPEVGVASTKAFTTQLTVLGCLTLAVARGRGAIDAETEARLVGALTEVPALAAEVLNHDERLRELAHEIAEAPGVLSLGRGTSYPIALEGALKLKEISYIHAEGYAAGEMKHGPIALIDDGVPVIVIAPMDDLFEKTASNIEEVMARNGRVIFFSDQGGAERLGGKTAATITLPDVDAFVAPILYAIPVQLLAYHTAVIKGTDVDQPRNLAKSVTVE